MPSFSDRKWSFAALGGLVVLNVVLIGLLLLRPTTPDISDADATPPAITPAPTATGEVTEPDPEPTAETENTPTEEPEPEQLQAAPAQRLLVNVSESIAWRGTVGTCEQPGTLEHTTDGGETWTEVQMELSPLLRLRVLGDQALFAIGGGADCAPTYLSSSTSGYSWTTNDQYLEGSWYIDPADRGFVSTPVGRIDAPCEMVDLAGSSATNAAILCTDGTVLTTLDGGASWQASSPPGNMLAIGVADGGYILAGESEVCEGAVAVLPVDLTGAGGGVNCTPTELDGSTQLAVSANAAVPWLWASGEVFVSAEGAMN